MRTSTKTKAIYKEEAKEEESLGPSDQWDIEVTGLDVWLGAGIINQIGWLPDWHSGRSRFGTAGLSSAAGPPLTEQMRLDSEI